jgi:hypothetical protein
MMNRPKDIYAPLAVQNWVEYADWLEAKVENRSEMVDRLKYIYGGEQKRIAELEAKVAEYEYPLRANGWVKVREEVWEELIADTDALKEALENK